VDVAADPLELGGLDGVFHLAGQPGVASFGGVFPVYVRQNVIASERLFEAAAAAGVRVVLASSSSIYGDAASYPTPEDTPPAPLSPYGITKLTCEHLARAYARSFGLDVVVLLVGSEAERGQRVLRGRLRRPAVGDYEGLHPCTWRTGGRSFGATRSYPAPSGPGTGGTRTARPGGGAGFAVRPAGDGR